MLDIYNIKVKSSVSFKAMGLSSGVYFYRLQAGSYSAMKKMILMK